MKSTRPVLSVVTVEAPLRQRSKTMIMGLHVQIAIVFFKELENARIVAMISDQILIKNK